MGRKKKERDPSAAEEKLKEEKEEDEAEVESEKRAGRRSSKPVVAKWAIGEKILPFAGWQFLYVDEKVFTCEFSQ